MLKVVLDTNQLVSSLLSTQGLQRQLINAWRRRAFLLFLAPGQIDEVAEVLGRPKIQKKYPMLIQLKRPASRCEDCMGQSH